MIRRADLKKNANPTEYSKTFAVRYKHDLGQHFLYDVTLLTSLVEKTGLSQSDAVLEIGPGVGTLTRVLCKTAQHVTAVEVDKALIPTLQQVSAELTNLTVIQQDIRKLDLRNFNHGESYWVIANIPYNITSQIFDLFWGTGLPVRHMCLMVQKEVADKLTATPGDPAYGLTSVRCRYYCEPSILAQIPASAFTPPPKVDSTFVKLDFRPLPAASGVDEEMLWRLSKAGYAMRRKTLANALKAVLPVSAEGIREALAVLGLPPTVRGEELGIEQWIALARWFTKR
jgi:16S rRNA (adenine1518-N6/adenine1519-N6)-dimethyltransferase